MLLGALIVTSLLQLQGLVRCLKKKNKLKNKKIKKIL